MQTLETVGSSTQTLAQCMAKGRIPVAAALRYSMILAEELRKIHEAGQAHGALTPESIAISQTGLVILPALGSMGIVTPYTAPEVVQGKAADSRSDIFSFGAILYEMLTGRAAFQGDGSAAVAAAIMNSAPPPLGSPAVDRLVANCIAKDPAVRWPRIQKLLLELKLISVALRRSESSARQTVDPAPALRAEMQQIESRLNARLDRCLQSLESVNGRLARMEQDAQSAADRTAKLEQAYAGARDAGQLEQALESVIARTGLLEQLQQAAADHSAKLEQVLESAVGRMAKVEQVVDSVRQDTATLGESVSEELSLYDRSLKAQAAAIESARTAVSQTDDLVERVVEALESLQSVVLDHADDRNTVMN